MKHGERKHSKFSASGAERWFNCPGSVALSEGLPDKDSVWSIEGTKAHEVLEDIMKIGIELGYEALAKARYDFRKGIPLEMIRHALNAARFILGMHSETKHSEVMIETRIHLDFIHPEMFGTFDGAVLDHFGTLHVFDYKYGAGHAVSPVQNLQMIFYGIGLAHKYHWNFKRVRLWIVQPRIKGYDGPLFWERDIAQMKRYVGVFTDAVERVEKYPNKFVEGSWCHWCKAKTKCPLKQQAKLDQARLVFQAQPIR